MKIMGILLHSEDCHYTTGLGASKIEMLALKERNVKVYTALN